MFASSSPNPLSSSLQNLSPTAPRRRAPNYKNTPAPPPPGITCSSSMDPLTSLGRLLWGRSLPPSFLISTARSAWHATWHLFMRQLAPTSPSAGGSYSRPPSQFPTVPKPYHSHPHPENLNLVIYAAHPCPWAHRTLLVLALQGTNNLAAGIKVSIVTPSPDGAWELENGVRLKDVYMKRRGGYDGRATVPMLWDEDTEEVVCNESYGIIEFFNSWTSKGEGIDLAPDELRGEIERWNEIIYPNVNNGVYRCGFAQSQEAYDAAVNDLFHTLDMLEAHLSSSRYLCGDSLTLADVCLVTTLIRFDLVYNVLFKCTKKKLVEYPNLHASAQDIYQIPNVAETCNFDGIMDGYYRVLFPLNPGSIRPVMPCVCEHEHLSRPHNRKSLASCKRTKPEVEADAIAEKISRSAK